MDSETNGKKVEHARVTATCSPDVVAAILDDPWLFQNKGVLAHLKFRHDDLRAAATSDNVQSALTATTALVVTGDHGARYAMAERVVANPQTTLQFLSRYLPAQTQHPNDPIAVAVFDLLGSNEIDLVKLAIDTCCRFSFDGTAEKFLALIPNEQLPQMRMLHWLGRHHHPETVHWLDVLAKKGHAKTAMGALGSLAKDDTLLGNAARTTLLDLIEAGLLPEDWNRRFGGWQSVAPGLAHRPCERARPIFEKLLDPINDQDNWVKSAAILGIARLDDDPEVIFKLADENAGELAAAPLAAFVSAPDVTQARRLLKFSGGQWSEVSLLRAALTVGGPTVSDEVLQRARRLTLFEQCDLRWLAKARCVDATIAHLVDWNVLPNMSFSKAPEWDALRLCQLFELAETSSVVFDFDSDSDDFPARNDKLIREFAWNSNGYFTPEAIGQSDGEFRFVFHGQLYSSAIDEPDSKYYSHLQVVDLINRALFEAGCPDVFLWFDGGGMNVYVFGDPLDLYLASEIFDLPLYATLSAKRHRQDRSPNGDVIGLVCNLLDDGLFASAWATPSMNVVDVDAIAKRFRDWSVNVWRGRHEQLAIVDLELAIRFDGGDEEIGYFLDSLPVKLRAKALHSVALTLVSQRDEVDAEEPSELQRRELKETIGQLTEWRKRLTQPEE